MYQQREDNQLTALNLNKKRLVRRPANQTKLYVIEIALIERSFYIFENSGFLRC